MKILYGTTNNGKFESMKRITDSLGIKIIGLNDLKQPLPKVLESGNNPLENAQIKARAYYKAFSMPVFSCDSGLYFDGLDESLQPGIYVRRVNGKELSDEEMTDYYACLAKKHGNKLIGRYRNAIYFVVNETTYFSSMDKTIETGPFILTDTPHKKRVKGFPLDSLSIDIDSGKYYYDMQKTVDQSSIEKGFRAFFENALAKIL